ncbi:hypothetical protein [Lacisediminihabitans sp.]|uniref:hypothetical protein n=1 Tax=Lacisediminihabitans sp. TaxID=2787631 RepID=UPI00374DF326
MRPRAAVPYLTVGLPPLVLAAVGVTHPMHLTASTAEYWRNLHIGILAVFPLLGFAPWLILRGRGAVLSWLVGTLGFLYAAFYTALDVLAGIGAGGLRLDDMGRATGTVFGLGRDLGLVGSVALVLAATIAGVVAIASTGRPAIPGALLVVVGSVLFLRDHIYFPVGVLGQLFLAVGWVALLLAARSATRAPGSTPVVQDA